MMQLIDSKLIVIVLLMAVIYILIFVVRKRIYKHRYVIVSILIITTVLISIIGYVYVVNIVAEQNMGMLSGRGHIWHYSNEVIKKNFIFGYGPDNLYYNYPQLNPYQQEFISHILIDKPHNMYLQVMIDTGIFGLIGFMILLVGMLLKLNKAIDFENDILKNTYLKALMLVIAAYMLQGLINDNHLTVQPVIYLLMGIGASLIKQTLDKAKLAMVKE
jgi:O-antigen ligase